jgi:hypothetical protein
MKTFSLMTLVLSIFLCSCLENKKPNGNFSSPSSDTIGYYSAKSLNGLGPFQLEKSTYYGTLTALKKEWRKDSRYDYNNYGSGLGEHFLGLILLNFDSTKTYQGDLIFSPKYLACNYIKAIGLYEYYISDIEISSLLLTFYHDTLIRIDCHQNDKIDEAFTMKYGTGKKIAYTTWKTPLGETNNRPSDNAIRSERARIVRIFEQIIWENENVKATSYTNIKYKEGKGASGAEYSSYDFSIISKNPKKILEIEKCDSINKSNYDKRRNIRGKEKLNNL